jgi:hypothetical protein
LFLPVRVAKAAGIANGSERSAIPPGADGPPPSPVVIALAFESSPLLSRDSMPLFRFCHRTTHSNSSTMNANPATPPTTAPARTGVDGADEVPPPPAIAASVDVLDGALLPVAPEPALIGFPDESVAVDVILPVDEGFDEPDVEAHKSIVVVCPDASVVVIYECDAFPRDFDFEADTVEESVMLDEAFVEEERDASEAESKDAAVVVVNKCPFTKGS